MNKNLKIGLILGGTALVLGTVIYFATRKTEEPVAEGEETGSEESKADTSEEKKTSESSSKPKSSRPKTTASKPSTTTTTKPTSTAPASKPATTVSLKGSSVSGVISKTQNPAIYKGKVVISSKDKTILMGAKGNKLYELKKGTTVGKIVGSSLTKTGDYLVTVQMNNGKSVLVNGNNLNFA